MAERVRTAKDALADAVMFVADKGETEAATDTVWAVLDAQGYTVVKAYRPDLTDCARSWFGGGWSERDTWPDVKIEFSLAPWGWRWRPRFWLDDLTWYATFEWAFVKLTLFTNGGRPSQNEALRP